MRKAGSLLAWVTAKDWGTPVLHTQSLALNHCVGGLVTHMQMKSSFLLTHWSNVPKVMICGTSLDLLQSSGEYSCAVCRTGVGTNRPYCNFC